MQQARLMRSETDRMLAGVCGGLAEYLGIDPVLVRLAFFVLFLASGIGLAIYLVLWLVLPTPSRAQPAIRVMDESVPDDPAKLKSRFSPAATVGVIMILFGAFFLLNQMGWTGGIIWPIILIGAGLFYLIRRGRQ
jgi:phage shock protein C